MTTRTRRHLAAALLLGGLFWTQSAQAACYCQQGHIHGNQCVAPVGPNNSIVAIGFAVCPQGAAPQAEPRRLSPEEMRRLNQEVAEIKRNNPQGCNPPQEGLRFCWQYWSAEAGGETRFYYQRQDHDATHGLQYLYDNRTGRLLEIQIYDRGIIPKGENGYAFHPDGSITVVEYARNNDARSINRHYRISNAEALQRLGLTSSVLRLNLRADNRLLADMQSKLPAGCSGTAKTGLFKTACSIKQLNGKTN